jgi:hypothetical protein
MTTKIIDGSVVIEIRDLVKQTFPQLEPRGKPWIVHGKWVQKARHRVLGTTFIVEEGETFAYMWENNS